MFIDIITNTNARIREVRQFLSIIRGLKPGTLAISDDYNITRGLLFVQLYGAWEYGVTSAIQRTFELINQDPPKFDEVKPVFYSLALHAECDGLAAVGDGKKWEKRWQMFRRAASSDQINLNEALAIHEGRNIKEKQLGLIWTTLCLNGHHLPRMPIKGTLETLVENRNKVAHGRESAGTVGRGYTPEQLEGYIVDIEEAFVHLVQALDSYITNREFVA